MNLSAWVVPAQVPLIAKTVFSSPPPTCSVWKVPPSGVCSSRLLARRLLSIMTFNFGASAEHRLGAAKGCAHVQAVFFGTGVGGAVIIHDRLYRGASSVGGQVGAVLAQPLGGP